MDEAIRYPTWEDVGIPRIMVNAVHALPAGGVLDYLVLNRVFRFNVRAQYVYQCTKCGYDKRMGRHYEDYSCCEKCGSNMICSTAYWRMGKDKMEAYSQKENLAAKVIQQMPIVYSQYFRDHPPDEFIKCEWEWDTGEVQVPKPIPAYGRYDSSNAEEGFKPPPLFAVQFCCGERVVTASQVYSICKAAVLCPFLWDDCFDWKHLIPKDQGRENHLLPLLNIWAKLTSGERPDGMPRWRARPLGSQDYPAMFADGAEAGEQGGEAPVEPDLPEAVMQVLQSDPGLIRQVFGGQQNG